MIARVIRWSIDNRFLVLLATLVVTAWGVWSVTRTPVDALPDLSDVQVIIRTPYPGQAPQIVENQVTYPLTTTMLSVPGAKTVRGYSFFGDSYVYVIFEDGTDLYWARSRVLEYLNQVQSRLPTGVTPALGPDATGVGWVYQYALVDRTGKHDLSQLRSIQDWFLKYELKSVPNVAEVATLGGTVREYQIVLQPDRLRAFGITHRDVIEAVEASNQEAGGSVLELGEAEYVVRAKGYLRGVDDFKKIAVRTTNGTPVRLSDVATVQVGPQARRGIAELDGKGEVTGGVIVMRSGKNALETIAAVKAKLAALKPSLPEGVEVVETYDRSGLIERSVENLTGKLVEEFIVVALVCLVFLFHLRSAFVAIVSLPLGILIAFIVMEKQGINANIMSLGGIAIAIGAMVDAAIVMIENAHKRLEQWQADHPDTVLENRERWLLIAEASAQVGPALFFSLLIITLSFVPTFTLEAQEGRLFAPLAFTKTYAMAAAAGLAVSLVPVLMGLLIRGRIPTEERNPLNRWLIRVYRPVLDRVLEWPRTTIAIALALLALTAVPVLRLGGEFMPPLDEGDILHMPSALPGLSAGKASQLLQQMDRMLMEVPEVERVFGKMGRAETATDPAPLEMVETTVHFKPRDQWRPGMTPEQLVAELDQRLKLPGLANVWVPPIRNRIDMLATGIKSPVGVKVSGTDPMVIDGVAAAVERAVKGVPGVSSALAERLTGGRYIDVDIDRDAIGRYGLRIADAQSIVSAAIGGERIAETVEGLQRFPVSVRYPRELRDSVADLRNLPIVTPAGAEITLGTIAKVSIEDGPPMLRSENARLSGWVYVDLRGRDLQSAVEEMQRKVSSEVSLPAGYSIAWSGQFEYLQRAKAKLAIVVPFTLLIIFVLLYLTFRRFDEALLVLATLPFALIGGFWFIYLLGHEVSVATVVGFIALAGVAAEFGVVMLIYLKHAWEDRLASGESLTSESLASAIREGAVLRVRPKAMTVSVILAGLLPIMWSHGTGSEVMQRIAAPMIGGMITAPLLSMLLIPVAYRIMRSRSLLRLSSGNI
ncbi:MAG TPA: efflux RND transporter permease subunit [Steroidobacteraceae bacterium]|nr:efflux RND transporter permease subunit [Steroidobacteraceae bacterium]